jgi:hypothetical protein
MHVEVSPIEAPRWPLGLARDPVGDDVHDPVRDLSGSIGKPVAEDPFDVTFVSHA